jgi:hypothetical protein
VLFRSGVPVFERVLAGETDKLVPQLLRCLSFYRRQDPEANELRLVLAQPMQAQSHPGGCAGAEGGGSRCRALRLAGSAGPGRRGVDAMNLPVLDLLRERREELGQPSLLPVLAKRTSTLRLGAGIGGALVVLAGVATVLAWLGNQYVRSQMANLERVEGEVSALARPVGTEQREDLQAGGRQS